jgi:hypothetical protein
MRSRGQALSRASKRPTQILTSLHLHALETASSLAEGLGVSETDHARIDTTQLYTEIRPTQLKRAVAFYEEKARAICTSEGVNAVPGLRNIRKFLKPGAKSINEIELVAPTGFEPVFESRPRFR